jgi:hypothetical protein
MAMALSKLRACAANPQVLVEHHFHQSLTSHLEDILNNYADGSIFTNGNPDIHIHMFQIEISLCRTLFAPLTLHSSSLMLQVAAGRPWWMVWSWTHLPNTSHKLDNSIGFFDCESRHSSLSPLPFPFQSSGYVGYNHQ